MADVYISHFFAKPCTLFFTIANLDLHAAVSFGHIFDPSNDFRHDDLSTALDATCQSRCRGIRETCSRRGYRRDLCPLGSMSGEQLRSLGFVPRVWMMCLNSVKETVVRYAIVPIVGRQRTVFEEITKYCWRSSSGGDGGSLGVARYTWNSYDRSVVLADSEQLSLNLRTIDSTLKYPQATEKSGAVSVEVRSHPRHRAATTKQSTLTLWLRLHSPSLGAWLLARVALFDCQVTRNTSTSTIHANPS